MCLSCSPGVLLMLQADAEHCQCCLVPGRALLESPHCMMLCSHPACSLHPQPRHAKALSQAKLTAFFGKPCSSPAVFCANKVSGMFQRNLPARLTD
jgi:hypothetical protein